MSGLKTVKLYGELGERFGREFHFDVKSPAEAIRLLSANFRDFAPYLLEHSEPGYHVFIGQNSIGASELDYPAGEVIKVVPVIAGAGGSGPFNQILLGVALVAMTGGLGGTALIAADASFLGVTGASVGAFGAALVLGGVSRVLFAPPTPDGPGEAVVNKPSYSFNGAVNTIRQGNPVPVGYGRCRVGSQVISAGLFSESI